MVIKLLFIPVNSGGCVTSALNVNFTAPVSWHGTIDLAWIAYKTVLRLNLQLFFWKVVTRTWHWLYMYGCFLPNVFSGSSHCNPLAFGDVSYEIETFNSPLVFVGKSIVNFEPISSTGSVTVKFTGILPPSVTTFTSLIVKSLTSSSCFVKNWNQIPYECMV